MGTFGSELVEVRTKLHAVVEGAGHTRGENPEHQASMAEFQLSGSHLSAAHYLEQDVAGYAQGDEIFLGVMLRILTVFAR